MTKFIALSLLLTATMFQARAQDTSTVAAPAPPYQQTIPTAPPAKPVVRTGNRSNDHFMLQLGYDGWITDADSMKPSGLSRSFNFYFMLNKPFKGSKRLSAGIGLGLGSSNVFFDRRYVDLKSPAATLPFRPFVTGTDSANFDKFKLTTIYAEIPVELRYAANADDPMKGFRAAIGVKVGALLKGYTKGKNLESKNGTTVYGDRFIEKEQSRRYLNTYRIAGTVRLSYGIFGIFGQYQILNFLKDGAGADIRPYSVGFTISGL